jgi:hypothetical protein
MWFFLKKWENCIAKIVLKGPSWPLVVLGSLPPCSKSRCPLLDSQDAQCILFEIGDNLCIRFPAKTIVSNHGSLLEKGGHPKDDKPTLNQ